MNGRQLLLVRHGESTWNTLGLMQGQSPWPPLTVRGRRQAADTARALVGSAAVHLLSSDAVRTLQTAQAIGHLLRLPVHPTPLLRERHWGRFQGLPVAQGESEADALADDEPIPGGESRRDVAGRLLRLLSGLDEARGPVVLVTHGDVVREALQLWGAAEHAPMPANGSVTSLRAPAIDNRLVGAAR